MKNIDEDKKIIYLQMIQNTINRMSTTSAIFKGFCATLITGLYAISSTEINHWLLLIAILLIICFLSLDIYYFWLEKRFRALYNMVRCDTHEVDFDLNPPTKKETKKYDTGLWHCVSSPAIYLFYVPAILAILIIILKFKKVL